MCPYRPESTATSFGTANRFTPFVPQYTAHAGKLSLLDWEQERKPNDRALNFDMYSKRKDNFLTKEQELEILA